MKYLKLDINKVELDIENPRIKQYLQIYKSTPTSKELSMALSGSTDQSASGKYMALRDSIEKNGGIFTPIIVNHLTSEDRYIVIEGNTRLKFYQEFYEKTGEAKWANIISIVYDDMPDDQIHAIRLQAHMVGARDWDAFSKAKYLDYLYNTEKKSMEYLKIYCGGQESYIKSLIKAYNDMMDFYVSEQENQQIQFDPQVFSYYVEAQKSGCKEALAIHGYDLQTFTKWVISEKIDRAELVRKVARVLNDDEARHAFEKGTLSDGIKKLDSKEMDQKKLTKADLYKMAHELAIKLRNLPYSEFNQLKVNPKFESRKQELEDLSDALNEILKGIEGDN